MTAKIGLGTNVLEESEKRINWVFETFEQICISFSGGKDSTVLFHLVAQVARKHKKKFYVLFVDWEVQYTYTINHIQRMKELYADYIIKFYWIALPLTTVNGVSTHQPEWISWQESVQWIRQPPKDAITDYDFFPFYQYAMSFENFVPAFSAWFARKKSSTMLIGIRTDESLNRFLSIYSNKKLRYEDNKPWTTASNDGFIYKTYPIYDWKVQDIWRFFARTKLPYNPLYDLMYQAGLSLSRMRICEPFGPEQRNALWLFHIIEPETWEKVCFRVEGAHSGSIYANETGNFYGKYKISKPPHHSWKSYCYFLLDSMPEKTAEHYRNKIAIYRQWYKKHHDGDEIPDAQDKDLGAKDIPSWRRICKTLIKNDYWCRTLSFSPNKLEHYERYNRRLREKRKEWSMI